MPLDTTEIATLSPAAVALGRQLAAALDEDSPGGRQVTRQEGRELLRSVTALAAQLALDLLD